MYFTYITSFIFPLLLIISVNSDQHRKLVDSNDWFVAIQVLLDKIYPSGHNELQKFRSMLLNENKSLPERAPSAPPRELPTCDDLGFVLRKERLLTADKRVRVSLVRNIKDNSSFICKLFSKESVFNKELTSILSMNHPSILRPKCKITTLDSHGFVMEYLKSGVVAERYFQDLRNKNKGAEAQAKVNAQIRDFSAAVLDCILYVHWIGYTSGDLKQPHVFRLENGRPVVIDFEEAVQLPSDNFHRTLSRQTSPETALRRSPLQENIDIWAFGTLLATWNIRGSGDLLRIEKSRLSTVVEVPTYFSPELRQVLFYCLQSDPNLRKFNTKEQISFLQNLSYWKGVDWTAMRRRWGTDVSTSTSIAV